MPKIRCDCDNIIYLGDIPSPNQWMIISDKDYDELTDKNLDVAGKIDVELVYPKMQIVVKCVYFGKSSHFVSVQTVHPNFCPLPQEGS